MFQATGGVNTHKGIVFSLGIICCEMGRLLKAESQFLEFEIVLNEASKICNTALEKDFEQIKKSGIAKTSGEKLYLDNAIRGIRGEAQAGFPSVKNIALPAIKKARKHGMNNNDSYLYALIKLISQVDDTCMIARSNLDTAKQAQVKAKELLGQGNINLKKIRELDKCFIEHNLSPGGCADLLIIAIFLHEREK